MIFDMITKGVTIRDSKDLLDYIATGYESASGVSVSAQSVARHGPIVALIGVLQRAAGQLPLNIYAQKGDKRKKAVEHSLHEIFKYGPNEFMTKKEWIELIVRQELLYGNHYSWVNRTSFGVSELLPLNPTSVEPKLDEQFSLRYQVTFPDHKKDVLSAGEILHCKMGMKTPILGSSPFVESRDSSGFGIALEKFACKLFANSARPGGILTAPTLTTEQINDIRTAWDKNYAGVENSHKIAILSGGLEWSAMGMNPDDAQFVDSKRVSRNELAGMLGVPPHMIGGMENATFSNIEHQAIEFVIHALNPILVGIEERINKTLLTPKERKTHYAKFNVNAILRGDMKARSEFYTKMVQNGAMSPNEIRGFEDMNPREGGDIYLTPMNMLINGKPTGEDDANKTA
ncbi:MAG: phage portal protein [Planctomycetaceae bacterium]|nr:phage portal protein [Planctomycetaceae bacterium]